MLRAWTRRCVTQQGPQFARTEGLFFFARGDACLIPFTSSAAIGDLFSSVHGEAPLKPDLRVRAARTRDMVLGAKPLTAAVTPLLICARRNPALSWRSHG